MKLLILGISVLLSSVLGAAEKPNFIFILSDGFAQGDLDIYPPLLDLCGIYPVIGLEGLSLRPQLDKPKTPRRPAITTHNLGNHSVRSENWRYIRYGDGSEEFTTSKMTPTSGTTLSLSQSIRHESLSLLNTYRNKKRNSSRAPAVVCSGKKTANGSGKVSKPIDRVNKSR